MGVTTTSELEDYLTAAGIEFTSIEQLSGGTANWVWRIHLPSGGTRVVKHAEPYVKSIPGMALDVTRIDFEADALSSLPKTLNFTQLSPSSPTVRIPTLHHYDNDAHILIMDDGGLHNLKAWYPAAPASAIPATGAALGTWLAQLHHRTQSVRSRDHLTARAIYRYSYANLAAAFDKFGLDAALAREIDAEYGSRLATDDACVCHGDFWPGNVLVREAEEGEGEGREEGEGTVLSVVDWEITRRGIGATDVAQFAAEAYLLDRFCGGKGLLGAFVEAYVRAAKEQPEREAGVVAGPSAEEFVRRFVVHFGVHVAFWPTHVEWCGEEETGELVKLGREYLIAGRDADWWYVGRSPLAPILELLK